MKNILVLGAGKSSGMLIQYLLKKSQQHNWHVTVADQDVKSAEEKIAGHTAAEAVSFSLDDEQKRNTLIRDADIVISLLPAFMHPVVAKDCVRMKKNFLSASYAGNEMRSLHEDALKADIILLNEMGLDPGIDHMSAMQIIHSIKQNGGEITAFESYTGGLIAPENDNNPWHYKFTWNPRNVVLAGKGTAKFLWKNQDKYVPYQKLFTRYDILSVPGSGDFEGYPNRDSLQYRSIYGLENIETLVRGTLRKRGFCDAWNVFVQLGMTDDDYEIDAEGMTKKDFMSSFLPVGENDLKENLDKYLSINDDAVIDRIAWLGFFSDEILPLQKGTPAQILQSILEKKWALEAGDKDMCVMLHIISYRQNNTLHKLQSHMVITGDDEHATAMAKTVGLPLAIAAKMILNGEIKNKGVVLPVLPEIYNPVLAELKEYGIRFVEEKQQAMS